MRSTSCVISHILVPGLSELNDFGSVSEYATTNEAAGRRTLRVHAWTDFLALSSSLLGHNRMSLCFYASQQSCSDPSKSEQTAKLPFNLRMYMYIRIQGAHALLLRERPYRFWMGPFRVPCKHPPLETRVTIALRGG